MLFSRPRTDVLQEAVPKVGSEPARNAAVVAPFRRKSCGLIGTPIVCVSCFHYAPLNGVVVQGRRIGQSRGHLHRSRPDAALTVMRSRVSPRRIRPAPGEGAASPM